MAASRSTPRDDTPQGGEPAVAADPSPPDGSSPDATSAAAPTPVQRRAPFSANPQVGARGQRTQQRILDAAVELFGEDGYPRTSVDRITSRVGCSRATFYQYFSSKEDIFGQLAGQVARQLRASVEALGPVGPSREGWSEVRAWVERHAEIYRRYQAVFHAFPEASEHDESLAAGSSRWRQRNLERFESRIVGSPHAPGDLRPIIPLLFAGMSRTLDLAAMLRAGGTDWFPDDRVGDALADVIHRSLFGLEPEVNVHAAGPAPDQVPFGPVLRRSLDERRASADLGPAARQTLETLTAAGHEVLVSRGYHRMRVDDVVELAGISHGAFYRYFDSTDHLARALATEAMLSVARLLRQAPLAGDRADGEALRAWLQRYAQTERREAAVLDVWLEAGVQDPVIRSDLAPMVDWGRRTLADELRQRGFGDVDAEVIVLLGILSHLGAPAVETPIDDSAIEAAAEVIEVGLLGWPVEAPGAQEREVRRA
jgi:AcrR family transcriptional regulator